MTLNREELRKAAANRRSDGKIEDIAMPVWRCDHCSRNFQTENGFMKHHCKEREKLDQLRSPLGQAAYSHYCTWMKFKKRTAPPIETFMTSRQYNYFIKFTEWSNRTAIPNTARFIELMVETDTPPSLWCRNTTYALYLQWYDSAYPPESQFIETLDLLKHLAREHDCKLKDIFATLGATELAKLIRRRKLSPWLLITSGAFLGWVRTLPANVSEILKDAINFNAYVDKMKQHQALVEEFRRACEQETI